jgi:hypothetical protein
MIEITLHDTEGGGTIDIVLSEETRLGEIFIGDRGPVYEEHHLNGMVFLTENGNHDNILLMADKDFYKKVFE